jgi:hypothetical protein
MNKTASTSPELQIAGALELSPSPERIEVSIAERYGHFIGASCTRGSTSRCSPR